MRSGISSGDLSKAATELGLKIVALTTSPSVKTHPARAARVALMHTWINTQDEGWWRLALDQIGVPFTYISTQDAAKDPSLGSRYDVILFPPSAADRAANHHGLPMYGIPCRGRRQS